MRKRSELNSHFRTLPIQEPALHKAIQMPISTMGRGLSWAPSPFLVALGFRGRGLGGAGAALACEQLVRAALKQPPLAQAEPPAVLQCFHSVQ